LTLPALRIEGLVKRFGARRVLQGFSLDVRPGEIVGLLGPNGCGKSTVLNTVAQLLLPDAGVVEVLGAALGPRSRARLALCAQDPALYADLLPAENLDFFARLQGVPAARRRSRVGELMQGFGLGAHANTRAGRLSGGWAQRLHLAVALVAEPAVLLLDEPTAAVDVAARLDLWALIQGLRDSGCAILLTTHQLPEAERLCDRVALMQGGRVAAVGSVAELVARVPGRQVALLRTADEAATLQRAGALGWAVRRHGAGLRCLLPAEGSLGDVVAALAGTGVTAVDLQAVGLEQAYLDAVGEVVSA
jgi:ABC-2 type transport system ATP-binding protein